jgi:alkylhydroperoxidase/carboxymuconolactone decarboxylase family protein YurZ
MTDATRYPVIAGMKANGQWNANWDVIEALDAEWMERFVAMGVTMYQRPVLDPKVREFIAIAVDASCTHMYAPGVRRHIAAALDLGATKEEIMAVLEAVAVLGIHSVALAAPVLVDELQTRGMAAPA